MLRLRRTLESGLRHPIAGPLLLLLLVALLAFVVFHVVEHGISGDVLACVVLASAALGLVLMRPARASGRRSSLLTPGRAPPVLGAAVARRPPIPSPGFFSPLRA